MDTFNVYTREPDTLMRRFTSVVEEHSESDFYSTMSNRLFSCLCITYDSTLEALKLHRFIKPSISIWKL
jgi:hypothetical protein